jgi:hypothetical protein
VRSGRLGRLLYFDAPRWFEGTFVQASAVS